MSILYLWYHRQTVYLYDWCTVMELKNFLKRRILVITGNLNISILPTITISILPRCPVEIVVVVASNRSWVHVWSRSWYQGSWCCLHIISHPPGYSVRSNQKKPVVTVDKGLLVFQQRIENWVWTLQDIESSILLLLQMLLLSRKDRWGWKC